MDRYISFFLWMSAFFSGTRTRTPQVARGVDVLRVLRSRVREAARPQNVCVSLKGENAHQKVVSFTRNSSGKGRELSNTCEARFEKEQDFGKCPNTVLKEDFGKFGQEFEATRRSEVLECSALVILSRVCFKQWECSARSRVFDVFFFVFVENDHWVEGYSRCHTRFATFFSRLPKVKMCRKKCDTAKGALVCISETGEFAAQVVVWFDNIRLWNFRTQR